MGLRNFLIALILIVVPLNAVSSSVIGVTSPKKDSVYMAGSTLYISYVFIDVDTVNIDVFSPANGGSWESVVDSLPTVEGYKIPIKNLQAPDWAHYQVRIVDFHHQADTAYSGVFTILNPPSPVMQLRVNEDQLKAGQNINFTWDISPSVDSIAFEKYDPWRKRWTRQKYIFNTRDSALTVASEKATMSGKHYYRLYDVNHPDNYSGMDSVFFTDEVFGGIDSLYPAAGQENVDVLLDNDTTECMFLVYFKEFIKLANSKRIEIYNESHGLVVELTTRDTARIKVLPDADGNPTILGIIPGIPLEHSQNYYVLSDQGLVTDMSGNAFSGFSNPTDWYFATENLFDFSGTVAYKGSNTGRLIIGLYEQTDIDNSITDEPANLKFAKSADFPYAFKIGAPTDGTYGIFCFLDGNDNLRTDPGEPSGLVENLVMQSEDTSGITVTMYDYTYTGSTFMLDKAASYWGDNERFAYNDFIKRYYIGDWMDENTPVISNAYKIDDLLWGIDFSILETVSADLSGSVLSEGSTVHLEFDFPDSLSINYIAAGGVIDGISISKSRLSMDLSVIDPVESASGNAHAALGLIISCSPRHSASIPAYGSLFYGDVIIDDIRPVELQTTDAVGVRVNGKDGVESHVNALLSDSFLIQTYSFLTAGNLPASSSGLQAFIPDLGSGAYSVNNSFASVDTQYDTDGDGKWNRMYRVEVANSSWSAHDIFFNYAMPTSLENKDTTKPGFIYNQVRNTIVCSVEQNGLSLYNLTGKAVFISNETSSSYHLGNSPAPGIYLIRAGTDTGNKLTQKIVIR